MNPEDLDLPQPPEGVLDPKMPWYSAKVSERVWKLLKAKLTGRRMDDGTQYSSFVNLTEADADKLIANLKKDPRGYPQFNNTGGAEEYENLQKYQEWLQEEYLEKPFRKQVDAKIEEADIQRVINQRKESKVKPVTPLIPTKKDEELLKLPPVSEVKPELIPEIPEEKKPELNPEIPQPVAQPEKKKKFKLRDEDLTVPYMMPSKVSKAMDYYGKSLDKVGRGISKNTSIMVRNLSYLRRIKEDLNDAKFLLEQMGENYKEAMDDIAKKKRRQETIQNFFGGIKQSVFGKKDKTITRKSSPDSQAYSDPIGPQPMNSPTPWAAKGEGEDGGMYGGEGFVPRLPSTKLSSGGFISSSLASGGIGGGISSLSGNIIQPGIYTNPVRGILPPGFAVIPMNRNWGKEILGIYDSQKMMQSLGEVLKKSINALLGAAVSVFGDVLRGFGPLAGYFNINLAKNIDNLSNILEIPRSAVLNLFGGPAYAGVIPNEEDERTFYKSWKIYMDENGLRFMGGQQRNRPLTGGDEGEDVDTTSQESEAQQGVQMGTRGFAFGDDGQETGVDFNLKGRGSNGQGRGLRIRNPIDNLYYFEKAPMDGFLSMGSPTRGVDGTTQRIVKGTGPSGFGHYATFYIKDSDGKFYELLIGHLDETARKFENNDANGGTLIKKGAIIGVQGASGSSQGDTSDGTYDHMSTHVNSLGRSNRNRSMELLKNWYDSMNKLNPAEFAPAQPPVSRQLGGSVGKPSTFKFTKISSSPSPLIDITNTILTNKIPTVATDSRKKASVINIPMPSSSTSSPSVVASSPSYGDTSISYFDTKEALYFTQLRRIG